MAVERSNSYTSFNSSDTNGRSITTATSRNSNNNGRTSSGSITTSSTHSGRNKKKKKNKASSVSSSSYPTALFEGKKILIITTAEPILTPVPASEMVVSGTVIMSWHPSHSSQRDVHKHQSIFSLISEKAYKHVNNKSNRNKGSSFTSTSSSYNLSSFLSAWGSKKKRRSFFASNITSIIVGMVTILCLLLMLAIYLDGDAVGFNRHDPDSPPLIHWIYKDDYTKNQQGSTSSNKKKMSVKEKRKEQRQKSREREKAKQSIQNQNNLVEREKNERERYARLSGQHETDHTRQTIISNQGKWDVNAFDPDDAQLMISDRGVPITYDLDEESLVAFRKMTRRAQLAGQDIKTIANTNRQFVLAVSGEELHKEDGSLTGVGLREILLCNKPLDNEELNTALYGTSLPEKTKRTAKMKFSIADVSTAGQGIGNIGGNGIYNSGFSVRYGSKTKLDQHINPITQKERYQHDGNYNNIADDTADDTDDDDDGDCGSSSRTNNKKDDDSVFDKNFNNQIDMRDHQKLAAEAAALPAHLKKEITTEEKEKKAKEDAQHKRFMEGGVCIAATLSSIANPVTEEGHAQLHEKVRQQPNPESQHQHFQAIPNSPYAATFYEPPQIIR